jgi:hypothetical protein
MEEFFIQTGKKTALYFYGFMEETHCYQLI